MPPSGVGGFPGTAAGFEAALASRYNHLAVMDYYHSAKTRKSRKPASGSGSSAAVSSFVSSAALSVTVEPKSKASKLNPVPSCGIAGCQGCRQGQPPRLPAAAAKNFDPSMGNGGPPRVRNPNPHTASSVTKALFVDCSVEYELPMVPKIPSDSQPLLVIHPGWQQKRRITRSSSQQRMALQQQHHQYLQYMAASMQSNNVCSQCPPMQTSTQASMSNSTTSSTAGSSRKRSYQHMMLQQQQQQPPQQPQPHPQHLPMPQQAPPCCYSDRTSAVPLGMYAS